MGTWTSALDGADTRAIVDLVESAYAADGTAPVSEQALHSLTGRDAAAHLVRVERGDVVGYANLVSAHGEHPAMAEVVVAPRARRRGIGAALVSAALAEGGTGARVWAHGNLEPARALAAHLGLVPARELLQMRRSLVADLPEPAVPKDISIRSYAGPGDDAELLRVNNAAFAWHPEQSGWREHDLAVRRREDWFDPAGLFVAEAGDGRMRGFHWTKVHRDVDPPRGEVYVVAVDPAAQGAGLGRVLTLVGLHHLHARGLREVMLYTEADNVAAVHTYERLGFERSHVDVAYAARQP